MAGADEPGAQGTRTVEDLDEAALSYVRTAEQASEPARARLREELIRYALPFAGRLARRYWGRGEPLEDLEQVARLGLVKAIDRYDPQRGSFTAYAVITISGEIKRHFRDKTWGVHVPRRLQDLSLEIGHATVLLTNRLSRTPTPAELAEHLDRDVREVLSALESAAGYAPASLNVPVGEGAAELGDLFGEPDDDLDSVDDRLTVARLVSRLPARERQILAMRFYGNRTQCEIAAEFGISQMHVSRLLTRALAWLREAMLSDVPPRWEGLGAGSADGLHVGLRQRDGTVVVRVRGEVDRDSATRLQRALLEAARTPGASAIRVDLSGAPLLDAAGVAALVAGYEAARANGIGLRVTGVQSYVARILAVSGLAPLID